jgi:RNA polymerase sigma-70 factor (ECF subfamily)
VYKRQIYYRISNYHEAEDVTEQVFLKAIQNLKGFQWRGAPFSSWLFRIAVNEVNDYFRSSRYETFDIDDYSEVLTSLQSPEEQALKSIDRDTLIESIKMLTKEQQEVLVLKYIIGMSSDEIAAVVKKRVGAVRALQFRALATLGKIMNGNRHET